MSKDEISSELEGFDSRIAGLESDLANCRSSNKTTCAGIQSDIDLVCADQAIAYKAWAER